MKYLRLCFIGLFFVILLLPVVYFNWEEGAVSEIDNRKLTNIPFGDDFTYNGEPALRTQIENYVEDRIGFRDDMILFYTVINDVLFHEMVHPNYMYGKEGHVFNIVREIPEYGEYHDAFADMVRKLQNYCEERGASFVFVFNPSKASVLTDKLADGINYQNDWVSIFLSQLEDINYIDNTEVLKEKTAEGIDVFNKKYNVGHWNDLGAFYGVNNILKNLSQYYPNLYVNSKEDYIISEKLNTTLMISRFPIYEYEPVFSSMCVLEDRTEMYIEEIEINPSYPYFRYVVNEKELENGAPKTLVFQGSYMNGMGYKFLQNSLGEYIAIHDYQNILNFDYYFNIFQPQCVIFEVAEYTFGTGYFNYEKMKSLNLNPGLDEFESFPVEKHVLCEENIDIEKGDTLTDIIIYGLPEQTKYAYLCTGESVFDMKYQVSETGNNFKVTIEQSRLNLNKLCVIAVDGDSRYEYTYYKK